MEDDPFATPESAVEPSEELVDAEAIRVALLPREGAVRMAATPFWVVGGLMLAVGGASTWVATSAPAVAASIGVLLIGALLLGLAKAVRDVRTWARAPALGMGVLLFALGVSMIVRAGRVEPLHAGLLLMASMPLLLLSSRASGYVFSPDYAAVVRATPHLQYRAPAAVWASLLVLVAAVAAIVWWNVQHGRLGHLGLP